MGTPCAAAAGGLARPRERAVHVRDGVACLFGVGLFGSTFLVPLFVQTVQGYTPLGAGLLLMPAGLILGLFMPFSGFLSDRIPSRGLIISGLLCFAFSSYWLATIDVNSAYWTVAGSVVLSRIGL